MSAVKKTIKSVKNEGGWERFTKFFRGVWAELKKVHWPSRSELITYTTVVFVSVAIMAVMIWIVDSALTAALTRILK